MQTPLACREMGMGDRQTEVRRHLAFTDSDGQRDILQC